MNSREKGQVETDKSTRISDVEVGRYRKVGLQLDARTATREL